MIRSTSRLAYARHRDYVKPDLMRIEGITGWLRAVSIAAAAGIQVSTHLDPEVSAHLMCATESAHRLEWQDCADPILAQPYEVRDGKVIIPERPDCGIEWDRKAVARCRVDP